MPGIVSLPTAQTGLLTGSADSIVVGTGDSGPGGIESIFEYAGAYFNIRDWYDTFVITSVDGLADADIRDTREVNPGDHGETPFESWYGGRTVVLTGYIRAYTLNKLRDMLQGLRQVFSEINQEKMLIVRTGDIDRDLMIPCKKVQPIALTDVQSQLNLHRRDFQITLRASEPWWRSYTEERVEATVAASPTLLEITNRGNYNARPVIRITGPLDAAVAGGPAGRIYSTVNVGGETVENELIINAKAGSTVALASGRLLEIDTAKHTIKEFTTAGAEVGPAFSQMDVNSDWFELVSGQQTVEFHTYAAGSPHIEFRYNHTYM